MITKKVPNWLTLITLAIGFIMATLDASIMNVAVATVQKELSLSSTSGTWIIDSYLLSFASLLLLGGVLANKFGSKPIYLVGMFLFLIGSISGGFSESGAWLIGSRFFQGVGAAFFMPSSLSLLVLSFEDKTERAKMLGIWSAVVSISSGVGPFVGGALIYGLGWRSIFFINVPLGIIGLVLAYCFAINPKSDRSLKLTVLPNLLSMIMLASFAYTLIEGGTYGIAYPPAIISFILFLITLFLFTSYERKSELPMIPLGLIKIKAFVFSNFTAVLLNSSMMGGLFIFGLYLQSSNHSTTLEAGAQLIPMMIVFMIGNIIFSRTVKKFGTDKMLIFGLLLAAIGTFVLTFSLHFTYLVYALIYAIANLGVGIVVPAMTMVAMQSATDKYSNFAGAIFNVARQIGSLFGVALLGVIFYQSSSPVIGAEISFAIMTIFYVLGIAFSIIGSKEKGKTIES
ncbi:MULTISPECIES: MFS transporter [Leuconostoc]|uniref:Methylenomycin A resistance protein n=2 Tax=Leuconostoc TaxID=1243 RepID=A0AAN2QTI1_9LACO|nr:MULTISPECIES: MFS transporter [Leuconostoc]MBZ5947131.1 MFS transporter [Leuconostoc gasicomitatum]MBZ5955014.1 MFS transporter [Leuconostoc gasicomitatum]MBZ5956198.1 MFS transporter [Leuconostoc gasicomitatum]MBZ5959392.1 MFS transporter [Leuconostoc gasicomitatum]MBZ5960005.1 MFS transporter [Leuconostoc gasicomitatum]